MIWPFKKSSSTESRDALWWREAETAAGAPSAEAIERLLQQGPPAASPDEAERRDEFVEGLRQVLAIQQNGGLSVVMTQHRVIGRDVCHFVAPASLAARPEAPGKLFLTSERLVFAGSGVLAWPWHRVRGVARTGRDLVITVAGVPEAVHMQCNSYADAMTAVYLLRQLSRSIEGGASDPSVRRA